MVPHPSLASVLAGNFLPRLAGAGAEAPEKSGLSITSNLVCLSKVRSNPASLFHGNARFTQ